MKVDTSRDSGIDANREARTRGGMEEVSAGASKRSTGYTEEMA
jgi:hypothetical protein